MSRKNEFIDQEELCFVTFTVINEVDLFARREYKDVLIKSWNYCLDKKGMELYGWVIMYSHFHLIMGTHGDRIEDILLNIKMDTSEILKQMILENKEEYRKKWMMKLFLESGGDSSNYSGFQLWQSDSHPIQIKDLRMAHQKLDFIHYNPVKEGIVTKPEDYLYSSASDYYGGKGIIQIKKLDPLLK